MNHFRLLSMLLLAVTLAACSTIDSRIDGQKNAFDSYPAEVQTKIRAGQVDIGFTPEQVLLAVGEPSRKYTQKSAEGEREVWAYGKSGPTFSVGLGLGNIGVGGSGVGFGGGVGIGTSTGIGGGDAGDTMRVVFMAGKVTVVERAQAF